MRNTSFIWIAALGGVLLFAAACGSTSTVQRAETVGADGAGITSNVTSAEPDTTGVTTEAAASPPETMMVRGTFPPIPPECIPSASWTGDVDPNMTTLPTMPISCYQTTLPPLVPVPATTILLLPTITDPSSTLDTMRLDPTTTSPGPTSTIEPPTTTTLPVGPPDPVDAETNGVPLHVVVRSADTIGGNSPPITVAVGGIVEVIYDNADLDPDISGNNPFEGIFYDHSAPPVVEQIQPRKECPPNAVCATFAAIATGSIDLGASVPGGEGFCACFELDVVDPTTVNAITPD